jgi:hypothetical protein
MASAVAAGSPVVVTAADMVAGHVSLDISCLDRLYLAGFVPKLQTPGGVIYFLHDHRGNPITSPALFEQIGNRFRGAMRQWVHANNILMIQFKAGDRKADVMAPYLDAAPARRAFQGGGGRLRAGVRAGVDRDRTRYRPGQVPPVFLHQAVASGVGVLRLHLGHPGRARVHQDLHVLPLPDQGLAQRA